ncbi:hypothetical protein [Okeania sp. SIO2B3]|uniref:hypothetical protein n=1 Tax=Okeania sp. SIO2B3 TaxID=2607784 RepID=UPI0013BEC0C0|nr:hypothetical protein [Okeania sp. SIO2B3]NET46184.1 hypothetical protein [Okeania sp. SIO2B3]
MGNLSNLIENLSNKISDDYQNRHQSDLMRLDADYQDNLRKMENEHRSYLNQAIDRIILDLEGRVSRFNEFLLDLHKDRPGAYATSERISDHNRMGDEYKKNLRAFQNDIEYLREVRYNDLSKYLGEIRSKLSDITRKKIDNLLDDFES